MARQKEAHKGMKEATKAQRKAYFDFLNTGKGEVADGTMFDGERVWVKAPSSTSASSTSSSSSSSTNTDDK